MDLATSVLTGLITRLAPSAAEVFSRRMKEGAATETALREHVHETLNRVSHMITYRAARQNIEDGYVAPVLIDTALTLSHFDPVEIEGIVAALSSGQLGNTPGLLEKLAATLGQDREAQQAVRLPKLTYLEVDQVISEPQLLCLGEAGSGKSSLMSYICYSRLKEKDPALPLFLDSGRLRHITLTEHLHALSEKLGLDGGSVAQWGAGLALYVDGLDEVPQDRARDICRELRELAQKAPEMRVAVSCRASAYEGHLEFLKEVVVMPFDSARSRLFVHKWFAPIDDRSLAADLVRDIEGSDSLTELAHHPLLLALMCTAFRRYLNVSRRQTALFEQCLDSLLWDWDARRAIRRPTAFEQLDLEKKLWLHCRLAASFHENHERFLGRAQTVGLLEEILPSFGIPKEASRPLLTELCSHHGIVVRAGVDAYAFGHLALQEYLSARWYSSERRWLRLIEPSIVGDPWWREVLALTVASLSDASDMVHAISQMDAPSELDRLRVLTHALRFDPILPPAKREAVIRRVLGLFHNGGVREHDAAIEMLVGIDDSWCAPLIRRSLAGRLPTRQSAEQMKYRPGVQ